MANDIRSSPWIIDTASPTTIKPGLTWTTGFVFRDYTGGVGSAAVVRDWRGIVIARLVGAADNSPVSEAWLASHMKTQVIRDIAVTAIDSGVLEILTM
jgi:hypothetical protein